MDSKVTSKDMHTNNNISEFIFMSSTAGRCSNPSNRTLCKPTRGGCSTQSETHYCCENIWHVAQRHSKVTWPSLTHAADSGVKPGLAPLQLQGALTPRPRPALWHHLWRSKAPWLIVSTSPLQPPSPQLPPSRLREKPHPQSPRSPHSLRLTVWFVPSFPFLTGPSSRIALGANYCDSPFQIK